MLFYPTSIPAVTLHYIYAVNEGVGGGASTWVHTAETRISRNSHFLELSAISCETLSTRVGSSSAGDTAGGCCKSQEGHSDASFLPNISLLIDRRETAARETSPASRRVLTRSAALCVRFTPPFGLVLTAFYSFKQGEHNTDAIGSISRVGIFTCLHFTKYHKIWNKACIDQTINSI